MSGGHFDYSQSRIKDIIERLEHIIKVNGVEMTDEELEDYYGVNWRDYKGTCRYNYPPDVIKEFNNGLKYLRLAYVYAQRIDWLICDDDGVDSFFERLKKDLGKLKK